MSERLMVIEPRNNLLSEAKNAEKFNSPLYLVIVKLGKFAINLFEDSKGELKAAEDYDIDFDNLEITQGKFLVDRITKSRIITAAEDGTMSKIEPVHKVKGVCSVGADPFLNPAILHIPSTEKYAAHIEIHDPDTEYLHSSDTKD